MYFFCIIVVSPEFFLLVAVWFGLYPIFAPVKWLDQKIIPKIPYNLSSGLLNPAVPCHLPTPEGENAELSLVTVLKANR